MEVSKQYNELEEYTVIAEYVAKVLDNFEKQMTQIEMTYMKQFI